MIEVLSFAIWLLSAVVGLIVFLDCAFKKRINFILDLIVLTIGEWWVAYTILFHKGFEHGWTVHMVNERTVFGFLIFGIANFLIFLRAYEQNG